MSDYLGFLIDLWVVLLAGLALGGAIAFAMMCHQIRVQHCRIKQVERRLPSIRSMKVEIERRLDRAG